MNPIDKIIERIQPVKQRQWPDTSPIHQKVAEMYVDNYRSVDKVCSLLSQSKRGVLIQGATGKGKTITLRTWYESVRRLSDAQGLFISSRELLTTYSSKGFAGDEWLLGLANLELLCIDDIGTEPQIANHAGTKIDVISNLLFLRYERWQTHKLRTYATTNLDSASRAKRYGERLERRFHEMFNTITVK